METTTIVLVSQQLLSRKNKNDCFQSELRIRRFPTSFSMTTATTIINDDELPADYECAICMETLRNPVTLPCKHCFCANCLEEARRVKNSCPVCRAELPARFTPVFAYDVLTAMRQIQVRCTNKGCGAVVPLSNWREHQDHCRFAGSAASEPVHVFHAPEGHHAPPPQKNRSTFTCPYCGMENLPTKDLVQHVNQNHRNVPSHRRRVVCPVCAAMPVSYISTCTHILIKKTSHITRVEIVGRSESREC